VAYKVDSMNEVAVVLKSRRDTFVVTYGEILTAERRGDRRRCLRLHVRTSEPIDVSCSGDQLAVEGQLRERGVRIVDGWGCIIAPTLADFEEELANKPVRMRQSYDDA
jgi:hypothetical protein